MLVGQFRIGAPGDRRDDAASLEEAQRVRERVRLAFALDEVHRLRATDRRARFRQSVQRELAAREPHDKCAAVEPILHERLRAIALVVSIDASDGNAGIVKVDEALRLRWPHHRMRPSSQRAASRRSAA